MSAWLGKKARDHLKKAEKLKSDNIAASLYRIGVLRSFMADLSSECRLARLAKTYGFEVELGKHPDLTINGKGIEVKRVHPRFPVKEPGSRLPLGDLSNPIRRGLKQKADIIAIQVPNLRKREIEGFKSVWMGRDRLRNVLETALRFEKNGRCVLLFLDTNRGYFGRIILVK